VHPDVCQPARLFHLQRQGFGRGLRFEPGWDAPYRCCASKGYVGEPRHHLTLSTYSVLIIFNSWATLNDSDKPAPTAEPGLTALSKEIRSTVDQEAQIIQAVFPMKEDVMRVFLQRVFAQVVSLQWMLFGINYGLFRCTHRRFNNISRHYSPALRSRGLWRSSAC
jgi:hypothetical protein